MVCDGIVESPSHAHRVHLGAILSLMPKDTAAGVPPKSCYYTLCGENHHQSYRKGHCWVKSYWTEILRLGLNGDGNAFNAVQTYVLIAIYSITIQYGVLWYFHPEIGTSVFSYWLDHVTRVLQTWLGSDFFSSRNLIRILERYVHSMATFIAQTCAMMLKSSVTTKMLACQKSLV